MEEYRLKMKAIDAQPIKKIAEAKARKKKKVIFLNFILLCYLIIWTVLQSIIRGN